MRPCLVLFVAVAACRSPRGPAPALTTTGETSGYVRTGRYDETIRLCHDFARAYRDVTCLEIGRSVEDRPIVALRIARGARWSRPTIYVQGGIHAGEIDGKDAGFWFFRDLLDGKVAAGALDAVHVVFVPVMNPDGHERFGPNHRPNQRGPESMGFRTNAANLNLNRDFVKADAPETRAVIAAITEHIPVVVVDLHTTDGAKFEHDISIPILPYAARDDRLDVVARSLSDHVQARLTALGHLPVAFYPSFVVDDDPASGFVFGELPPRFATAYATMIGRIGVLVETHSWRTYRERVTSTYHCLQAIFERAITDAPAWSTATTAAGDAATRLGGKQLALAFRPDDHVREIEFRGYAYERVPSDISGATRIIYDESTPQVWKVPLRDRLVPAVAVTAPKAGYIVDGGFAPSVRAVLDTHHVRYSPLEPSTVDVEAFRATKVEHQPSFEGRAPVTIEGGWKTERRVLDRGAIFVPIAQPTARLIVHLFEPASSDSLARWGYFNAVFERKEYIEAYVLEQAALDMLAADPSLRAAFDAALAADPELAASPARRLDWFYRRHPAADERKDLLPIYRTDIDFDDVVL